MEDKIYLTGNKMREIKFCSDNIFIPDEEEYDDRTEEEKALDTIEQEMVEECKTLIAIHEQKIKNNAPKYGE